jgi:hypothetical protein
MIVATALLGMTIVGLLSLMTGALSNAARVREYDRAAMLAQSKMNELLTVVPMPLARSLAGNFDAASGWEAMLVPVEVAGPVTTGSRMLVRVQLTVWWRTAGERRSLDVESYRAAQIRSEEIPLLGGFAER